MKKRLKIVSIWGEFADEDLEREFRSAYVKGRGKAFLLVTIIGVLIPIVRFFMIYHAWSDPGIPQ